MANLPTRQNNPGDLRDPATGGFRDFATPQEGYAALLNDLHAKQTGTTTTGVGPSSTLADFAKVYAPPNENNTAKYAADLANSLGVAPNAPLHSLDLGKWADAIAKNEGYQGSAGQTPQENIPPIQQPQYPSVPLPGDTAHASDGIAQPPQKDALQTATDIVGSIFPGKQVGEAIGTLGGYLLSPHKDQYDLSAPSPLQVAGDVAQGALTVGAGGLGKGAGLLGDQILGHTIPFANAAKTGLGTLARTTAAGAGIGASGALAQGETDPGKIAQGGLIGGIIGGGLGAVGGAAKTLSNTRNVESIIANRSKELQKLEDNYSVIRKVTSAAQKQGIDVKNILANTDLLQNAVDETGTIRTQNAIQELNDFIKPQEDIISRTLARDGQRISLTDVEKTLTNAVNDSGVQGGALTRALQNVKDDIAGYALKADKEGYVPLSLIHDAKVDKYANINYLNPETKRVDKVIAKALKQIVEKNTTSVDAKALNKELSQHYSVLNLLEKLDGKKVQGGKLGKYFAQTVGSIVGSHFGPLGAIAGAEAGGRILGKQMAGTFGRATGNALERSPAMNAALELADKPPVRKLPVQGQPSAFTNELPTIEAGPAPKSKYQKNTKLPTIQMGQSKSVGNRNTSHAATTKKTSSSTARSNALKRKAR